MAVTVLDKRRYAAPIDLRILIGEKSGNCRPRSFVHSDFFKFVIERIGFARIMWITELANQIAARTNMPSSLSLSLLLGGKRVNSMA